MSYYRLKKRMLRFYRCFFGGIIVLVVTTPYTLPLVFNWMCRFVLVAQSSCGYKVSLAGGSFISTNVTVLHYQDRTLYKITYLVDDIDSSSLNNSRAFWSQDGALFVVWNKGDKSYLVLDCAQNTVYGTRRGKILLQHHGGEGQLVFDGRRDLEARSRYIWPWEKIEANDVSLSSVKYIADGASG